MSNYDTVIDPEVLFARLGDPDWCAIDCRASLADATLGGRAYRDSHIPGAVYADLAIDLSGAVVPGVSGRHPLPDPGTLAATCGRWGIGATTQVVAYDASNGAFAARAWWLLRWLGHASVAVLNGGFDAWRAAGYQIAAGTESRAPQSFPRRTPLTRTIDASEIVASDRALALIDARNEVRFRGEAEPIDPVAGHIPGAVCVPFEGNLDAANRFAAADVLRLRFDAAVATGRDIVCYCGSGVTACHDVLAMRIAGLPEPALYAGSWSEWIQDPKRPVAR
jgi:thiosulfate/3-mercaptopyruvate sulfurtransferase